MKKIKQKKPRKSTALKSVLLDSDIKMYTTAKHNENVFFIVRILMAFAAAASVIALIDSFVHTSVSLFPIMMFTLLMTVIFSLMKSMKKTVRFTGFFVALIIMLIIVINKDNVVNGVCVYLDKYLTHASQPSSFFGSYAEELTYSEKISGLNYAYISLSAIVSFFTTVSIVYYTNFILLFLSTFPYFVVGLYWGWKPDMPAAIIMVAIWTITLSLNTFNYSANKQGRKNTFAIDRRTNTYYFTSASGRSAFYNSSAKFIALICALIFTIVIIFSAFTGFVRPDKFNYYSRAINRAINNIDFNSIGEENSDDENIKENFGFFGITAVGGTNGGILGEVNGISFNNSTALKISMPEFRYPMYLRGYSGGVYKNNSWNAVEIDKQAVYYTSFRNDDVYPQDITNINIKNALKNSGKDVKSKKIKVTVKGASKKFAYAPYGTDFSGSNKDKQMKMCEESYMVPSKKEYELEYADMEALLNSSDYFSLPSQIRQINGMNDPYPEYTEFVQNNYLNYPDSDALNEAYETILNDYLDSSNTDNSDEYEYEYYEDTSDINEEKYSYENVSRAIRDYFSDNFKYTLSPGATPEGEDFIDYFLTKQKKGYCSYFATAGTELLRMFGFPARYAEGYIVLPSQYSQGEFEVKDTAAHAWSEVYQPGVGWVPAEFTPGYEEDNPNLTIDPKKDSSSNIETSSTVATSSSRVESSTVTSSEISSSQTTTTAVSSSVTDSSSVNSSKNDSHESSNNSDDTSSDKSSAGTVSSPPDKQDKSSSGISAPVKIIVIVLTAALLIILIRRIFIMRKLNREIYQSSPDIAVKAVYVHTLKILSLAGINCNKNLTDKQLYENIVKQCDEKDINLDKNLLEIIFENAVISHMGGRKISQQEAEKSIDAMNRICNETIKPTLNVYEKIKAKFFDCLI